jgi:maltose alpha-D-glucosyltransferase / alpha-amylase
VIRVMRFWLDMGVDGLRLDAIPYLCVREGTSNENLPETHAVIKRMRAEIDARYQGRMLLAEANQWPEDVREYFGDGDECHMAYHFPLMPRIYMAVAQEERHPIVEVMQQTPEIPDNCQWAIFLRNHDELTLEMVTRRERDYLYQVYAADPRMRLNVGIRRRLAPLMENNREKIELVNFLLMTMPGSPILYYGDEIGMGDNIYLGDRNGVRTPMQWSPDRNAGFSRADPQRLYLPPIMDPVYGYEAVNVEAQSRNPSSLLNWTKRLIAVRKNYRAFGRGTLRFLRARQPQDTGLHSGVGGGDPALRGESLPPRPAGGAGACAVEGAGAGGTSGTHPLPAGGRTPLPAHPQGLRLLRYLPTQRWFAAKGQRIEAAKLLELGEWTTADGSWLLTAIRARTQAGDTQDYLLPLASAWEDGGEEQLHRVAHWVLARIRQRARVGVIFDALADDGFCRAVLGAIREQRQVALAGGELQFTGSGRFAELDPGGEIRVYRPPLEQSNTAIFYAEDFMLKVYRKLHAGSNPELEMGRFLTDVARFPRVAALLGAVEYHRRDGVRVTLAILQAFVPNQGNAWSYTLDYLERFIADHRLVAATGEAAVAEPHSAFLALMETLGRRTAELHAALATVSGDPAFDPEPITSRDLVTWCSQVRLDIEHNLERLAGRRAELSAWLQADADRVLAVRADLLAQLKRRSILDNRPDWVSIGATWDGARRQLRAVLRARRARRAVPLR